MSLASNYSTGGNRLRLPRLAFFQVSPVSRSSDTASPPDRFTGSPTHRPPASGFRRPSSVVRRPQSVVRCPVVSCPLSLSLAFSHKPYSMQTLSISKAKAGFSRVTRNVIKTRQPVVVQPPGGFVQIVPYDLPEEVPPAPPGSLGSYTEAQYRFCNTFGDSL